MVSYKMEAYKTSATILFCDIRNFTPLLEQKDPIEAITFANDVLAVLGSVIEENGGTVDRFTGDGFLAHFGVEKEMENHADIACNSMMDLKDSLSQINSKRYLDEELVVSIGVGIHTGVVAVGKITTGKTTQTTVLGDTVNTAARIESLTKYFAVDILISENTKQSLSTNFLFQKMPLKKLKGKKKNIQTHWLLPMNSKKQIL